MGGGILRRAARLAEISVQRLSSVQSRKKQETNGDVEEQKKRKKEGRRVRTSEQRIGAMEVIEIVRSQRTRLLLAPGDLGLQQSLECCLGLKMRMQTKSNEGQKDVQREVGKGRRERGGAPARPGVR